VEKEVVGKKGTETGDEVEEQEDEDNADATDESEDEMEV
jgi:ribosome biogenesis protein SSF1/2